MAKKRRKRSKNHENLPITEEILVKSDRHHLRVALIMDMVCPECLSLLSNEFDCLKCKHPAWEELIDERYVE